MSAGYDYVGGGEDLPEEPLSVGGADLTGGVAGFERSRCNREIVCATVGSRPLHGAGGLSSPALDWTRSGYRLSEMDPRVDQPSGEEVRTYIPINTDRMAQSRGLGHRWAVGVLLDSQDRYGVKG